MQRENRSAFHAYVQYRADAMGLLQTQLARAVGLTAKTLRGKLDAPDKLSFGEFRKLMAVLKVDDFNREKLLLELGGRAK